MNPDKPHLLVVDDEPLNRDLLRRLLEVDYRLSEAEDADEALEILADRSENAVQLVLCDQLMPGATGVELAGIATQRWPDVGFLLITGYDQDPDVLEALEQKTIRAVLAKPWRSTHLRSLITENLP